MLNKWILSVVCLSFTCFIGIAGETQAATAENVSVSINEKMVQFPDAKPLINDNNRMIVPIRFVSELLGYHISWNGQRQIITLTNDSERLSFRVGQYESVIINSRTYVPLRYVAEAFGAEVQWNGKERLAAILTENLIIEPTSPIEETETEENVPPNQTSNPTEEHSGWEKTANQVIHLAEKFYGVDYEYGAKVGQTNTFDCSSLTQYVFGKNGISLRRASRPQFLYDGNQVLTRNDLRRGDLIFFSTAGTAEKYEKDDYRRNGHVGIVKEVKETGEIIFIHTYKKGIGVTDSKMYADLDKGWWNHHFLYGKRIISEDGSGATDRTVNKSDIKLYTK